jgi:YhcH/YjgK/YiaL family protein
MIMDNIYSSHTDYAPMSPKLARAFEWLKSTDLKSLKPDQVISVDGERISAQIQQYSTIQPEEMRFETHRSYIDIQIVVSGRETIFWTPMACLGNIISPYDYHRDVVFFEDSEVSVPLLLVEGDYAVFFPSDGHKPKCVVEDPETVHKIVVKVAV